MLKIIIAGSREFNDYQKMKKLVLAFLEKEKIKEEIEIVSGGCRGADRLGEILAQKMGWNLKRFPANWKLYGKAAGIIRNREMAEYADICFLFPVATAENKGTKNMIQAVKRAGCRGYIAR